MERDRKISCGKKRLFLWLVCAPAVVLSSSRRNTIFLLCFFVWTVLYTAVKIKKEETDSLGKYSLKAIVSWKSVLQWAAVLMGVIVLTGLMQIYLDWQYERMEERARLENREVTGISDGSALERYEQIAQEGGESKRKIIWSVAIREYADFSLTEKLTGKGFGYDRLLYQKTDDRELLEAYAPESRSLLSAALFCTGRSVKQRADWCCAGDSGLGCNWSKAIKNAFGRRKRNYVLCYHIGYYLCKQSDFQSLWFFVR